MDHMVHWTIWYIGPLGALEHLVQRWNTWCIGPFGTVDHLVHLTKWSTWAYGPLDHLDQCTNWSIVPNGPCKKNISPSHSFILLFSLLPPLISLLSSFPFIPSSISHASVMPGMYALISLHYVLYFNTYLIHWDLNRGCCGESVQLYQWATRPITPNMI